MGTHSHSQSITQSFTHSVILSLMHGSTHHKSIQGSVLIRNAIIRSYSTPCVLKCMSKHGFCDIKPEYVVFYFQNMTFMYIFLHSFILITPCKILIFFIDCVKAYYKRAKAYAAVWDEKEARKDFNMVASLDISLAPLIHKELKNLSERMKEKYWEEKEKYWNILETEKKDDKEEEEEEEVEVEEGKAGKEREPGEDDQSTATVVEEGRKPREDSDPQQEVKEVMQAETEVANEEVESSLDTKTETNQISPSVTEGKDWQQMLLQIKFLQDEGNFRFKEHRYEEASGKFKEALEYVDFLQTKVSVNVLVTMLI